MDQNSRYNKIKDILSIKTNSDGHSGASFAVCLRGAIEEIIDTGKRSVQELRDKQLVLFEKFLKTL